LKKKRTEERAAKKLAKELEKQEKLATGIPGRRRRGATAAIGGAGLAAEGDAADLGSSEPLMVVGLRTVPGLCTAGVFCAAGASAVAGVSTATGVSATTRLPTAAGTPTTAGALSMLGFLSTSGLLSVPGLSTPLLSVAVGVGAGSAGVGFARFADKRQREYLELQRASQQELMFQRQDLGVQWWSRSPWRSTQGRGEVDARGPPLWAPTPLPPPRQNPPSLAKSSRGPLPSQLPPPFDSASQRRSHEMG
jgi:hypothetical protein